MVQTILEISPPWFRPKHYPSRRALVFPTGVSCLCLSAEDPEQARGPNADLVWADELGVIAGKGDVAEPLARVAEGLDTSVHLDHTQADSNTCRYPRSTHDGREHGKHARQSATLEPGVCRASPALYKGTRFEDQEIKGRLIDQAEGDWFGRFDPAKHVSESAAFKLGVPVEIAVDAGTSRHTAAVIYQTERVDRYRVRFKILADYLAVDRYSGENAEAILRLFREVCPDAAIHHVWIDPASSARTSIGPTAIGEYENVFGSRFVNPSPGGNVADGLDCIEAMLGRGDLLIGPRCVHLIDAFKNYHRAQRAGEWLDVPALNQSPYEDSMDALRYGIRGTWPDGRRPQPNLIRVPFNSVF